MQPIQLYKSGHFIQNFNDIFVIQLNFQEHCKFLLTTNYLTEKLANNY